MAPPLMGIRYRPELCASSQKRGDTPCRGGNARPGSVAGARGALLDVLHLNIDFSSIWLIFRHITNHRFLGMQHGIQQTFWSSPERLMTRHEPLYCP
jgi:hypothetical protein